MTRKHKKIKKYKSRMISWHKINKLWKVNGIVETKTTNPLFICRIKSSF